MADFRDEFFDDDDDDFSFDDFEDDAETGGDDFSYDDDSFDEGDFDNEDLFDDDEGDDLGFIEEGRSGGGGGGPSRAFLLIAGLLIIVLLAGVVLLFLAINGQGDQSINITRTFIANVNATTEHQILETQTQSAINAQLTQTAAAASPTPSPTSTPSPTPTDDLTATFAVLNATGTAQVEQTQVAADMTLTALGNIEEVTEEATVAPTITGVSPVLAAQMTATAIAALFQQTPISDVTQVATTGGTTGTVTTSGEMPDTGLFDDLGADKAGVFFLMAFGLVGVIVGSRRVRAINKRKRGQ